MKRVFLFFIAFIISLLSVSAANWVIDNHGVSMSSGGTTTTAFGISITPKFDILLANVTKRSDATCNQAYITINGGGTVGIATALVGNTFTFDPFLLESGVKYNVYCHSGGSSYTYKQQNIDTSTYNKTNVIFEPIGLYRNIQTVTTIELIEGLEDYYNTSYVPLTVNEYRGYNWSYYINDNNTNYESGAVLYYQAEDDFTSVTGINNGTDNGGITFEIGKNGLGKTFELNGSQYISTANFGITNDVTQCAWVKPNTISGNQGILSKVYGSTSGSRNGKIGTNGDDLQYYIRNTSGTSWTLNAFGVLNTSLWTHVCAVTSGNDIYLYVDGVLQDNDTFTGPLSTGSSNFEIGAKDSGSGTPEYFNGFIDEVKVFNISLNSSQISNLYQRTPYTVIGDNIVTSTSFNTSTLTDDNYNITFVTGNHTNLTYETFSFTIDTTLPVINNNILAEYTTYTINGFNSSCSDTYLEYCNISLNSQNVLLNTTTFTFTSNGNISYNITAKDLAGNIVGDSGVILVNPYQYFYFVDEDNSTITNFTINGINYTNYYSEKIYDIGLGSIDFTFTKAGFKTETFTRTMNTTSSYNETIEIPAARIYVNIYNRETRSYLTGLTELTLIGPLGLNTTSTNGTAVFESVDFQNGDYQIIATHSGYASETAYFTFDREVGAEVDIFMLNSSLSNFGSIIITSKDQYSQFVQEAICKVNEWNTNSSAFLPVAQGKTNGNGVTTLNIEIGTKLYLFTCEKDNVLGSIPDEIIYADLEERTIILREGVTEVIGDFDNILADANETVVGNSTTITYGFTNLLGTNVEACIKYYRTRGTYKTLLGENCVTASSGLIQEIIAINNSFNLLIEATIEIDSKEYNVNSFPHKSINDISFSLAYYGLDKFVMPIAMILALVIVYLTGFHFLGEFAALILLWAGVGFVPNIWNVSLATVGSVVLGLMMYWGYKTK